MEDDSRSEKSLDVFDDGRDDHDAKSVRTANTARTSPNPNPLTKLRTLDAIIPPEKKDPPPADRRNKSLQGTQPQKERQRSRTPRRSDPIAASQKTTDHRATRDENRHSRQQRQPTPAIATSHRDSAAKDRPRSRSPSRRTNRRDYYHSSLDRRSTSRGQMPPPRADPLDSPAIRKLSRALRDDNKGRDRFDCFSKDLFESVAAMFCSAGYDTLKSIKEMQELNRTFFLQGIRKDRKAQPNFPELRLLADLFETYGITSTPKCAPENPRIEELTIPKEM